MAKQLELKELNGCSVGLDNIGRPNLSFNLQEKIEQFEKFFPYKESPYNSRSWGHRLHSLSSYQGKLKPAIAYWVLKYFAPEGGSVLDPLGGVGTIPFEAALSGRRSHSNDKNPFPAVVATGKLNPPLLADALVALDELERKISRVKLSRADYEEAKFGLNATVADYYHPDTLTEILSARKIFSAEGFGAGAQPFIWASLLHVLHGNRPYALSRCSHPITPFNPTGPVEYRSLIDKVKGRMILALKDPLPDNFCAGTASNVDFRELPAHFGGRERFDVIFTSPPFLGMRFDRPNWLRMWFCGWTQDDFHKKSLSFLERQQTKSMDCYVEFFSVCSKLLSPSGILILHIGASETDKMPTELSNRAQPLFEPVGVAIENVEGSEKHGLKDKGRTTEHQFLFFRPNLIND